MAMLPTMADAAPMARALIAAAPDRLIWGSDYPHLSFADKVGSVQLFNLLADWTSDEATRRKSWSIIRQSCSDSDPTAACSPYKSLFHQKGTSGSAHARGSGHPVLVKHWVPAFAGTSGRTCYRG